MEKDIDWFKKNIQPLIKGFEINYKFFEEGDFGSLNQVEFNSEKIGGNIDFWGSGWLGVFIWNFEIEEQLENILLDPDRYEEKEKALEKAIFILQNS